jgi:cell division protein FtsB
LIAAWPLNPRPLITSLYVVLLSGLGLGAGALFLDTRAHYRQLKQTEAIGRQRLAEAEARLREQKKILERLRTDPDYVEKVIRKRLGYARPGEVIFLFPD